MSVSVVVPTIGRAEPLARCLASLAACDPAPAEILVVDQSGGAVAGVIADAGATRVACPGRGIPLAVNTGLRAAAHDLVAITHDDCTVDPGWAGVAARELPRHPEALLTGRVLPVGDPRHVPATRTREAPYVFAEPYSFGALLPNNMAVARDAFLAFGGFDERFDTAGEDLDVAHRWVRGARTVRYEPAMLVHHAHWRRPEALRRTYVDYARGAGLFYAKHLLARDRRMLRHLRDDARDYARALRRGWDPAEPALGFVPGTIVGLAQGLWRFR